MKILLAFDTSKHAEKALEYTVKLCQNLKEFELHIINIVALNPKNLLPILDQMEKVCNLELQEQAEEERKQIESRLEQLTIKYEFFQIEGHGDVGVVLSEYLSENTFDMLVMGSSHKGTFGK